MSPPRVPDSGLRREAPSPARTAVVPGCDAETLIEAGLAAERAGQRPEARASFEAALHRLSGSAGGARAASLMRWIARTYTTDADLDAAMDCAAAALAVSEACGDRAGAGHAVNVQAAVHWAQGDLDAAERLFHVARSSALETGERALAAMTSQNLGVIAQIRGDLDEALHHYSVGLGHYRALDRLDDARVALNNMGRLHTDLGQWEEAERVYAEAIELSDAVGDRTARIGLEVNRAEMWLARGDLARASGAVGAAMELTDSTGDSAWRAQIAKLRGILHREAEQSVEAEACFTEAIELAEARHDTILLAETLRECATLFRAQGRNRETLLSLNRAHKLFTELRAKRELANVDRSVLLLEGDFVTVVKKWGESIEAKDRYTQGHCMRVADLACSIATRCGIDGQSLFWFRIGALLHDVGKLVVPSEVLNKAGKLTDEEWKVMRSHPTAGVDMLAGIDFPWDVRPIIESHHERWDGRGYPHGLKGDEIPLSARILTVADVYDALTSIRSYKSAHSHEAALEIMRRDIGTAFDPEVFALFEDAVREGIPVVAEVHLAPVEAKDTDTRREDDHPVALVENEPPLDAIMRAIGQALADRAATNRQFSLVVIEISGAEISRTGMSDAMPSRLLSAALRCLQRESRSTDFLAQISEDRLMAFLPDADAEDARVAMRRWNAALAKELQRRRMSAAAVRMAVVTAPNDGDTVEALFASAARSIDDVREQRVQQAR